MPFWVQCVGFRVPGFQGSRILDSEILRVLGSWVQGVSVQGYLGAYDFGIRFYNFRV